MGSVGGSSSVAARRLASAPHYVVGTRSYFGRSGIPATPAELIAHTAVIYEREGSTWSFRQGATEVSVGVSGPVRVKLAEGVRAAVLADLGLAVASAWMFSPELRAGTVQRVVTALSLPPIDLWAVYPTGQKPSAKASACAGFGEALLKQSVA